MICDSIPEPLQFYLGPGKPPQLITSLTFRSGGLHFSATKPISTVASITTAQKRKRDNANSPKGGEAQQEKSKKLKGEGAQRSSKMKTQESTTAGYGEA